jgi:cytochrome oxidase assembly protein ShyY1
VIVVAAIVAVTCVLLGSWQLRRLDDRRARNAAILERRSAEPIAIEDADADAAVPFLPATAEGTYDVAHEVLLYGRTLDGASGHHVVTPLVLPGGDAILVDRGWVPFAARSAPVRAGAPPISPVTVEGSLVPDEGDGSLRPDDAGVIRRLDVRGIAASVPYDVFPLPLLLATQSPPQREPFPAPAPLPTLSEGPHLSYAIQWFAFAGIAVVGAVLLLRRDRRGPTGSP